MEGGRQSEIAKAILAAKNVPYVVAAPLLIQVRSGALPGAGAWARLPAPIGPWTALPQHGVLLPAPRQVVLSIRWGWGIPTRSAMATPLVQDMASWVRDGIGGLQSVVLYSLPELDGAIDTGAAGGWAGRQASGWGS